MAVTAITPQAQEPTGRELARREKNRRRNRSILRAIMVPTVLAALYYILIAPLDYQSHGEFTIQGTQKATPDLLSGFGIPAASGASNDAKLVADYLKSAEMVKALRGNAGFAQAYSRFTIDPFSHLSADAPIEKAVAFWRKKAKVDYDATANIITISVSAYRPEDSKRLAEGMLAGARKVVEQLDNQVSATGKSFAARNLAEQKRQYDSARQRVAAVRATAPMTLDAQATQAVNTAAGFDQQIARLQADRAAASTTYQPGAPQARAIDSQIAALQVARMQALNQVARGPGTDAANNDVAAKTALVDYDNATKSYFAALNAYNAAQSQSDGNHRYIVAFIPPGLPEQSNYFSRLWNVLAVALAAAILVGVSMLTYSIVKDHAQ